MIKLLKSVSALYSYGEVKRSFGHNYPYELCRAYMRSLCTVGARFGNKYRHFVPCMSKLLVNRVYRSYVVSDFEPKTGEPDVPPVGWEVDALQGTSSNLYEKIPSPYVWSHGRDSSAVGEPDNWLIHAPEAVTNVEPGGTGLRAMRWPSALFCPGQTTLSNPASARQGAFVLLQTIEVVPPCYPVGAPPGAIDTRVNARAPFGAVRGSSPECREKLVAVTVGDPTSDNDQAIL